MSDGIELTDEEAAAFVAALAEQRCQHSHADAAMSEARWECWGLYRYEDLPVLVARREMLRATQIERILIDLIAELRGQADIWQEGDINEDRWDYPAMMLRAHADWAEARLHQITEGDA